ncbi:MAG: ABC transporter ATP-binding protein [Planctomycetales bacterium]
MLRLRDVSKTYHTGELDVPVLHGVSLDVARGDLMVVVGPSGSGKSTLLNIVGGIDTPTSGEVWFDDRDIAALSEPARTTFRRESVGFVFQFYNLVPTLTARENVLVATEIARDPLSAEAALEIVELSHRLDHFPAQLSGGEQQRVAIARAIAKRPALLLCDEPTGALDLPTARRVLGVLERLHSAHGTTVLIITHNSAIAAMARTVVRLGSGTIAEISTHDRPTPPEEIAW